MTVDLTQSPLFRGLSEDEIAGCLQCSRAETSWYDTNEIIFNQEDAPTHLMMLIEGAITICNDTDTGKRSVIATFDKGGELFGEVFVFLNKERYDNYAQATAPSSVLRIPKEFFFHTCSEGCGYHTKLISNMLAILAQKAYVLNQKVQILSCATLRQKIAKLLLKHCGSDGKVTISMNREVMADFLNTARPSLSRELMNMQHDGLIRIRKREIFITDFQTLQNDLS